MVETLGRWDFDFIPPVDSISITLDVSPVELELAVASAGRSLCSAMMNAIVAAMVVDQSRAGDLVASSALKRKGRPESAGPES